ncbi:MAG: pilus assembly protein TadE [Actinobacteria bacterium]|nr:pilus assembly protein TadE [Actinomycetota bacterium]
MSARSREAGMVAAELAVAMPAVVVVLALALSGLGLGLDQIRCTDAVGVAARAAARGDGDGQVVATARARAPSGTVISVSHGVDSATVTADGPAPVIGLGVLPGCRVSATAAREGGS